MKPFKIPKFTLFSQISDDDRMSLTTAVSDEDDGESIMASPYKSKGTAASSFNCTGAVRKAGCVNLNYTQILNKFTSKDFKIF